MKKNLKIISFILILVLSALACNLPGQDGADQKGLDDESLKTSVAATISAADPDNPVAPANTEEPGGDATENVATATLEPTGTPTETQEPTPTVSPTPPAGDPKLTLGDPDFRDQFNSGSNWTVHDEASSTTEIKNGRFYFTKHNPSPYSDEWLFTWPEIKDFYLEVTAVTPDSCTGKDRFGLIFRAPTYDKGYIFYLACDGTYKLNFWNGANMIRLKDWTASSKIEAGASKANRLGVKAEDNDISLYVNGKFLVTIEDDSHIDEGYFGFVITGATTAEFTVTFDELMYWE